MTSEEACREVKDDWYKDQMLQWYCYNGCYSLIGGTPESHNKKYHKTSQISCILAVLPNEEICPHCEMVLMKYVNPQFPLWIRFSCDNKKECKYRKIHNSSFNRTEFIGERKKHHCTNHHWNDDKKCPRCIEQIEINKETKRLFAQVFSQ